MELDQKRTPPVDPFGRERRVVELSGIEIRAAGGDGNESIGFKGHAAIFDTWTWIGSKKWGFREKVARGAFTKTLQEADVRFLHNHSPNLVLGRNKAGTLRLAEDKIGLATDADMAPTTYAKDLAISLERGDITQMSFGFRVIKDEWFQNDEGHDERTLIELMLFDVSTVTFPAYTETDAALRGVAFDVLCTRMGLQGKEREMLLGALDAEDIGPDAVPILRAASSALADLARAHEPKPEEPAATTPRSRELLRRRMRAAGLRFGLDTSHLEESA